MFGKVVRALAGTEEYAQESRARAARGAEATVCAFRFGAPRIEALGPSVFVSSHRFTPSGASCGGAQETVNDGR